MDEREAIAGAEAYETLHVPALFAEWTSRVLDAGEVAPGHRVLDVACGTGILARAAAARAGSSGGVVGVDPNPGMLAVAARLSADVQWLPGAAEDLPCEDSAFDRVVSQFGLMFFTDRTRAVREMVRVLAPGGRFAIAVWDSLEKHPAYRAEVELLERLAGPEAAEALSAPFVLGDAADLRSEVEEAAGAEVRTSTVTGRARFPSLRAMVEADLRGWLPVMGIDLEEALIQRLLQAADRELASFVTPDGRVEFDSPAHILSATRTS